MRKLKLTLEQLRVESFDTQRVVGKDGTVHANEGPSGVFPCDTENGGLTCADCSFLDLCGGPTALPCSLAPPYVTQCDYSCEFAC